MGTQLFYNQEIDPIHNCNKDHKILKNKWKKNAGPIQGAQKRLE